MRRLILWGLVIGVALAAPAGAVAQSVGPIVRFTTTFGNIDVQLNSTDAPNTVTNFLYYVNHGLYNGSFFHRALRPPPSTQISVIQGGGYTFANGQPVLIPQQPTIPNEYRDSNVAGTLAMALVNSSTTTATDQWFFNVADNSAALNPQRFTVFGQVLDPNSMNVVKLIAAFPINDLSSKFGNAVFATVPTIGGYVAGSTPTAGNLVFVNSISVLSDTASPVITIASPVAKQHYNFGQKVPPSYKCSDGTGTGVQQCSGPSIVDTSQYGTLDYTVAATDYAGNVTSKTATYVVELPAEFVSASTVSSKGVLWLHVRCPASVACGGTVTISAGKPAAVVGSSRFLIPSDTTRKLRILLTSGGKIALRTGKGRLGTSLSIAPSGTGAEVSTRALTVHTQRPRKRKHRR